MSDLICRSALLEEVKSLTVTVMGLRAGKGVLHGYDLVSRKMVVQYLQEQQANVIIEKAKKGFVSDDVCDGMKSAVDAFMNFIVQAPSEEAVPVVHGEWIFDKYTAKFGNPYRCSNCNEEFGDTYNFCPNCGSRMNGGTQNSYRNRIIDEFAQKAIERLEDMGCEAWRKDILAIAEEMKGRGE